MFGDPYAELSEKPKNCTYSVLVNGVSAGLSGITHETIESTETNSDGSPKQKYKEVFTAQIKNIPLEYGLNIIPISITNQINAVSSQVLKLTVVDKDGIRETKNDYTVSSYELVPQGIIKPKLNTINIVGEFNNDKQDIKVANGSNTRGIALHRKPVANWSRFTKDLFVVDDHPMIGKLANGFTADKPAIQANPGETVQLKTTSIGTQEFKLYVTGLNIVDTKPTHIVRNKKFTIKAYTGTNLFPKPFEVKIISKAGVLLADVNIQIPNSTSGYFDGNGFQAISNEIEIVSSFPDGSRFSGNRIVLNPGEMMLVNYGDHTGYALYQQLPDAKTFEAVSGVTPSVGRALPVPWFNLSYQVYLHNRQMVFTHQLFDIPGRKLNNAPTITYRSGSTSSGVIGKSWFASWEDHFVATYNTNLNQPSGFLYIGGNGREDLFESSGFDLKIPKGYTIKATLNKDKTEITVKQPDGTEILYRQLSRAGNYRKVSIKDRFRNQIEFKYDANERMKTMIDDLNRFYSFEYSEVTGVGTYLSEIKDYAGMIYTFQNTVGKLENVALLTKDKKSVKVEYTYNSEGMMDIVKINSKKYVDFDFEENVADEQYKVAGVALGDDIIVTEVFGQVETVTDVLDSKGVKTRYDFDYFGHQNLVATTSVEKNNSMSLVTVFEYDLEERIVYVKDPMGNINMSEYKMGTQLDKREAGAILDLKMFPASNIPGTPSINKYTYYGEDKFYQRKTHKGVNNVVTTYTYLGEDSIILKSSTPVLNGNIETSTYLNNYGQIYIIINPDESEVEYKYYDSNLKHGNIKDLEGYLYSETVSKTKDLGNLKYETIYGKDIYGRTISVTPPKGAASIYEYNSLGQLETEIAPPANDKNEKSRLTTKYKYNTFGVMTDTTIMNPVAFGNIDSPGYKDVVSNIHYEIDGLNRVTKISDSVQGDNGTVEFKYEGGFDRLDFMKDEFNSYTYYFYDKLNNIVAVLENALENATIDRFSYPAKLSKYEYNDNNELTKVSGSYEFDKNPVIPPPPNGKKSKNQKVAFDLNDPYGPKYSVEYIFTRDYLGRITNTECPIDASSITTSYNENGYISALKVEKNNNQEMKTVLHKKFDYVNGQLSKAYDQMQKWPNQDKYAMVENNLNYKDSQITISQDIDYPNPVLRTLIPLSSDNQYPFEPVR